MNEFKLALKTKDFDYYVNVDESDENNSVIMKNYEKIYLISTFYVIIFLVISSRLENSPPHLLR